MMFNSLKEQKVIYFNNGIETKNISDLLSTEDVTAISTMVLSLSKSELCTAIIADVSNFIFYPMIKYVACNGMVVVIMVGRVSERANGHVKFSNRKKGGRGLGEPYKVL